MTSEFIDLVESKCEKMMDLGGYLKSYGDKRILRDVTKKLIKPEFWVKAEFVWWVLFENGQLDYFDQIWNKA